MGRKNEKKEQTDVDLVFVNASPKKLSDLCERQRALRDEPERLAQLIGLLLRRDAPCRLLYTTRARTRA